MLDTVYSSRNRELCQADASNGQSDTIRGHAERLSHSPTSHPKLCGSSSLTMSRDVLSPLAGFSPLLSFNSNRQQRQTHVPAPLIIPGYPVDEHAKRARPAEPGHSARAAPPPSGSTQAARSPPVRKSTYPTNAQRPATAAFPSTQQPAPAYPPPPYSAAQSGSAYAQQASNAASMVPTRPQSAPPLQARLEPVNSDTVDPDDIVWINGKAYDKGAFARSLTPQTRLELAQRVLQDHPGREVAWLKWEILCRYGFDPDDYHDVARYIESCYPRQPAMPALKGMPTEFQASVLGESKARCRKLFKRARKAYTCDDVSLPAPSRCMSATTYNDGWPCAPASAYAMNPVPGVVPAQGPSIMTAPLAGGFQHQFMQPAAGQMAYYYPGLPAPSVDPTQGWTFVKL